jgi:nitroreductase
VTLQQSTRDTDKIAFLRGLRQIRQLSPQPVPAAALQDILDVARWTGSARNIQPWDLLVIQDRATLQTLAHLEGSHAAHLANAGAGIALVMSGDLEHPEFDTYDEGRLSERIMLAAAADSLGSAIGWFRDGASDEAKRILNVPPERLLRTIVSIGFPDTAGHGQRARPPQPRKALSEIVHHEKFA